jgi:vacuolar-type H+-ATPase subunit F/Vma7
MTHVPAIGARRRVTGLATAGVVVLPADDPEAVRAAWSRLPADVGLVILTPDAAAALGPGPLEAEDPLTAVMPA